MVPELSGRMIGGNAVLIRQGRADLGDSEDVVSFRSRRDLQAMGMEVGQHVGRVHECDTQDVAAHYAQRWRNVLPIENSRDHILPADAHKRGGSYDGYVESSVAARNRLWLGQLLIRRRRCIVSSRRGRDDPLGSAVTPLQTKQYDCCESHNGWTIKSACTCSSIDPVGV